MEAINTEPSELPPVLMKETGKNEAVKRCLPALGVPGRSVMLRCGMNVCQRELMDQEWRK